MKDTEIKITLPEGLTVHIPSFGEIDIEDVGKVVATDGVRLIKDTIHDRVMRAFIEKHEEYIRHEVDRLVVENEQEIKKLLNNKT